MQKLKNRHSPLPLLSKKKKKKENSQIEISGCGEFKTEN